MPGAFFEPGTLQSEPAYIKIVPVSLTVPILSPSSPKEARLKSIVFVTRGLF